MRRTLLFVGLIAGFGGSASSATAAGTTLPVLPQADPDRELSASRALPMLEVRLPAVAPNRWTSDNGGQRTVTAVAPNRRCGAGLGAVARTFSRLPDLGRGHVGTTAIGLSVNGRIRRVTARTVVSRKPIETVVVVRLPRTVLPAFAQRVVVVGVSAVPIGARRPISSACAPFAIRQVRRIARRFTLRVTGTYVAPAAPDPAPLTALSAAAHLTIGGATRGDGLGGSVVAPGDMTGDGRPELALRTDGIDVVSPTAPTGTIDLRSAPAGLRVRGLPPGFSYSAAGDVDGDGLADLAIGLPDADGPGGVVRVVHGRTLPGVVGLADAPILVRSAASCFGSDVEPAGDFDGDGRGDLVIAAPSLCAAGGVTARVFVVPTPAGGGAVTDVDAVATQIRFSQDTGQLTIRGVGDVNGDGLADVAVGSPDYLHTRATIVFGAREPAVVDFEHPGARGITLAGEPCAGVGAAIAPAGDFDGDGLDDVLISAPQSCGSSGPVPDAKAYVLRGGGPAELSAARASDRVVRIDGLRTREDWADPQLTVAAAGDRTGDGFADVLLGDGRPAYLVPGRAGAAPISLARLGASGRRLRAPATIRAMTTLGDLDGDGRPELAIGLPGADFAHRGAGTGAVFVTVLPG